MSDDALQAAADALAEAGSHKGVNEQELIVVILRAYFESPDVAGCDCDNGQRQSTLLFGNDVWNRPEWGPCDRCVVVDLPDVPGVRVRRDVFVQWSTVGVKPKVYVLVVPAEGVDDE